MAKSQFQPNSVKETAVLSTIGRKIIEVYEKFKMGENMFLEFYGFLYLPKFHSMHSKASDKTI